MKILRLCFELQHINSFFSKKKSDEGPIFFHCKYIIMLCFHYKHGPNIHLTMI